MISEVTVSRNRNKEGSISTPWDLWACIREEANTDSSCMKIIHRGKTLTSADDISLLGLNSKENDEELKMGKVLVFFKDDPCFCFRFVRESEFGCNTEATSTDKDASQRDGAEFHQCREVPRDAKKAEKRLSHFSETAMKHIVLNAHGTIVLINLKLCTPSNLSLNLK